MSKTYVYVRLALLGLLAGYVVHLGIQDYKETSKLNDCGLILQNKLSEAGPQYNPRVLECKRIVLKGGINRVACSFEDDLAPGQRRSNGPLLIPAGVCD